MADDIAERIKIDIAERIRRLPELANLPGGALGADCFEAAMEIEALRAENARLEYRIQMLEAALRNIYEEARCADVWDGAARAAMGDE